MSLKRKPDDQSTSCLREIRNCLWGLGPDAEENISSLTSLAGRLLTASSAVYNRVRDDAVLPIGRWSFQPDRLPPTFPLNGFFLEVASRPTDRITVIPHLGKILAPGRRAPRHRHGQIQAAVGCAVRYSDQALGSLCLFFEEEYHPSEAERAALGIIAGAIGREEQKIRAETCGATGTGEPAVPLSGIPLMACVVSAQGHMEYVNRHLAERLGYVSEDLVGSSLTEFLAPETTDPVAGDGFRGWFDEGVTLARVFLVAKDGDRIPVMVSASIIPSPADRHSCLVSFQDVQQETPAEAATSPATAPDAEPAPQTPETQSADQPDSLARERRRREAVETELERNRAILGSIADDSPDGLFLVNSEGLVLYSNAAASRMFGRGDESLDGSQFNLPLVPGQAAEVGIVRPGTSPGVAELRVERTSWNSSPAYVARLHDVTKERKREDEAKRQEALLEGLRRLLQRVSSASGSEELARICRSMAKEISGEEPESS